MSGDRVVSFETDHGDRVVAELYDAGDDPVLHIRLFEVDGDSAYVIVSGNNLQQLVDLLADAWGDS